jgi:signal transduction histidine kinase
MLNLVPEWAQNYQAFWDGIRKRNLWFIKLRYSAFTMLLLFFLFAAEVLKVEFSRTQLIAISAINISILAYNLILHRVRKYLSCDTKKFNPLDFSLVQMVLDLIALLLLVHYTGGIESPLYMLFVFHMIIGSLILPGVVVYSMALMFTLVFSGMIFLEYFNSIPHHSIAGLFEFHLYQNIYFIGLYLATFVFVILSSVYIANGIARQLYKREQALVDSLHKINTAEVEKQRYIMGIVHEIKTPITAVVSFLDLVLQKFLGLLDEVVEEKLIRAKSRADEGIHMINDVLNISKLKLYDQFDVDEFKPEEILCRTIRKQKSAADAHMVHIEYKDERKEKKKIKGDKFLLDIVFSNLIGNSIKYGKENGKVIVTMNSDKENLFINITDDGLGIPENDLPKIFNDFFRASNVKKVSGDGSGLGLSVVKQIIERHNGTITAVSPSEIGTKDYPGTTFEITIPLNPLQT